MPTKQQERLLRIMQEAAEALTQLEDDACATLGAGWIEKMARGMAAEIRESRRIYWQQLEEEPAVPFIPFRSWQVPAPTAGQAGEGRDG